MNISAVNAATSAYGVTNQDSKAAMTTETGKGQQKDSVSLSPEAVAAQRKEQYALKTDPVAIYNTWLESESRTISFEGSKPYEDLLPETQGYIDQLNKRLEETESPEKRDQMKDYISGASRFGDKEIIRSDSDIQTRWQVEQVAVDLMMAHSEINNEEMNFPEELEKPENSAYSSIKNFGDISSSNAKSRISDQSHSEEIALSKKQSRENLESFFYGWLNGSRTMEDEISLRNVAAQNFNEASGRPHI